MDLYRIVARDNRTVRYTYYIYKQNFKSSEFDLSGLHCTYVHDYRVLQHEYKNYREVVP